MGSTSLSESTISGAAERGAYRPLGSYRLLLAGLVLISHTGWFLGNVGGLGLGNVGVFAFFVLSGFVITEALDRFYRGRPADFLKNRALKIYPAYFAALILAYGVNIWLGNTRQLDLASVVVNVTLLPSFLTSMPLEVSIAWAVVVECKFYILAAVVAASAARWGWPVVALAIVGALALYFFVHLTGGFTRVYGGFRFAPYFTTGVLFYFALRRRWLYVPTALSAALSLHAFAVYAQGNMTPLFIFAAVIALFVTLAGAPPGIWKRADRMAGDLTYPIYLAHMPLVAIAGHLGLQGGGAFAFVVPVVIVLAVAIHVFAERPVMRLRDRFRKIALYD